MAWPSELQFGVVDAVCEGRLTGHQPIILIVLKATPMNDGQRAVALLTDGGSKYPQAQAPAPGMTQRAFVRCILRDSEHAQAMQPGSIVELVQWSPNTVAKSGEKIIVAQVIRKIRDFDLTSAPSEAVRHPLNVSAQGQAASSAPPQQQQQQQQTPAATGYGAAGPPIHQTAPPPGAPTPHQPPPQQFYGSAGGAGDPHHGQQPYGSGPAGGGQPMGAMAGGTPGGAPAWGPVARRPPAQQQSMQAAQRATPYGPVARRDSNYCVPISGITTFIAKWQIKARVTSKATLKKYNNARGEGQLFSADLVDQQGGEIRATFFNKAAEKFFPILQPNMVFYFSKGTVKQADKRFNKLNHSCELQFGEDASINPAEDDKEIPRMQYNFSKIAGVNDKKKNDNVDILAVVLKHSEVAQITIKSSGELKDKRDWTLLDDSGYTVEFSLWGDKVNVIDEETLLKNPVVAIKGARVDEFQGRKLTAGFGTMIDASPDLPEAAELLSWYQQNRNSVQPQSLSSQSQGPSKSDKRSTLAEILDSVKNSSGGGDLEDRGLWFTASAVLHSIDSERQYFWTACPVCNKKVREQSAGDTFNAFGGDDGAGDAAGEFGGPQPYFCQTCNKAVDQPARKYLLNVELEDSTAMIRCVAMAEHGKTIMGTEVNVIEAAAGEPDSTGRDKDDYFLWKRQEELVFRIQAKAETYNDDTRIKYRIFGAEPLCGNFPREAERKWNLLSNVFGLPSPPPSLPPMTPDAAPAAGGAVYGGGAGGAQNRDFNASSAPLYGGMQHAPAGGDFYGRPPAY